MDGTNKNNMEDSTPAVTLTVGQLKGLIQGELAKALSQNGHGKELLTPEEVADRLKVPLSWVYEQSRQGNIPTHRLGRYIRFDLNELLACTKKDHPTT